MQFPLNLSFKILALAPQISVTDASGALCFYVKQKLLKLKESVSVFADQGQTRLLYKIDADRVIDFNARYNFTDAAGKALGSVSRKGMRSLWRAEYHVTTADGADLVVKEDNGWIKFLDGALSGIPVLGMFTGYFLNPAYSIVRANGEKVAHLKKLPAFMEGKFRIDETSKLSERDETTVVLGIIMILLLERHRG